MQDQRGAGRLAGAGRTEQREMLAEHRVDIERAADILGRIDGADLDMRALVGGDDRSEEHTSELQSLMRISYAVFCLKKTTYQQTSAFHIHQIFPASLFTTFT